MKKKVERLIIGLTLIGAFLRLYRFYDFVTFLGDQGRDAIVLRRILTLEHFPAIGPTTSIGNIYLGPFYYYFISPWLLLSRFDPVGPALGVAFFSIVFIGLSYLILRELIDKNTAIITAVLITFSKILIDFSRFSWNPNLLPVFSLATFYLLMRALKTKDWRMYVLSGALLSFCMQLHYIALSLIPASAFVMLIYYRFNAQSIKKNIKNLTMMTGSFLLFSVPLIIFDLRHNFLNARNFIALFTESGAVSGGKINQFVGTFSSLVRFSFNTPSIPFFEIGIVLFLLYGSYTLFKKRNSAFYLHLFFFIVLLISSLYGGPRHPHYFVALYSLFYVVLAYWIGQLLTQRTRVMIAAGVITLFIFFNIQGYYFLSQKRSNQITHSQTIARAIFENVNETDYQLTGLPDKYSEGTYRYFLELWGKRPIEKDVLKKGDELFVICEKECAPIGDPQWDIAYFAPTKIIGEWTVEGVKIYKLTR